ncbi:MAG TPA: carbamoyltransferase HypF [Acidimicrobiales bacterium]
MAGLATAEGSTSQRWQIRVTGTVQGVGFRPFVYRHAVALGLDGWVANDSLGVLIDAEGRAERLDELTRLLRDAPPPLAHVDGVAVDDTLVPTGAHGFRIAVSEVEGPARAPVSVDSAPCPACLAELFDPTARRYRYPFTNCTDCGPRYTIVRSVPYDRPATTMAGFTMCPACQAEYDDPADRRFHAQPNACPDCGPVLTWRGAAGDARSRGDDAVRAAVDVLGAGGVVAVKGIGGYHLAVDATSDAAVATLRLRKHRDDKPFAVMVPDEATATALAHLDPQALAAMRSRVRPIVVAPTRGGSLARGIADGLVEVGLMLPYSPLHHLLLADVGRPLVMTSGNVSDEPIAHTDDDAGQRLGPMVDGLLTHDRAIHIRCDDSIVRSTGHGLQVLRRSRGLAPEPMGLPRPTPAPVLAVGAELKNTIAVARGATVVASHHIGDLEHLATYETFLQAIAHLCDLFDVEPAAVAHDLHPEYLSTKWADDLGLPLVGVQHHHAHVAACLLDHGRDDTVVALAFDGIGYGDDDTLWGGEVLIAGLDGYRRAGHLRSIAMPGGVAAIREPWRMATAWATAAGCAEHLFLPDREVRAEVGLVVAGGYGPVTTSIGRLFDALGSIVTGRTVATYEAQTAVELEALARRVPRSEAPAWAGAVAVEATSEGVELDPRPLVVEVVDAVRAGVRPELVAAGIHEALGRAAAEAASAAAVDAGLATVVLTGGAFQNVRLSEVVRDVLEGAGLEVLEHRRVPPNDGGISLGQVAVAAARL